MCGSICVTVSGGVVQCRYVCRYVYFSVGASLYVLVVVSVC